MLESMKGATPQAERKEQKEQKERKPIVKFKEVVVWCPRDVEIKGREYQNGETLGTEVDLLTFLNWAEEIHNQGGSIQAVLPDGRNLSSYVGVYNEDETPVNGNGIWWKIKEYKNK